MNELAVATFLIFQNPTVHSQNFQNVTDFHDPAQIPLTLTVHKRTPRRPELAEVMRHVELASPVASSA